MFREDVADFTSSNSDSSSSALNKKCRLAWAREITSFCFLRSRKYCRTSSKARQNRWAKGSAPKPSTATPGSAQPRSCVAVRKPNAQPLPAVVTLLAAARRSDSVTFRKSSTWSHGNGAGRGVDSGLDVPLLQHLGCGLSPLRPYGACRLTRSGSTRLRAPKAVNGAHARDGRCRGRCRR